MLAPIQHRRRRLASSSPFVVVGGFSHLNFWYFSFFGDFSLFLSTFIVGQSCKRTESINFGNGAASAAESLCIPIVNDYSLPRGVLMSPRFQDVGSKPESRLRIFSGTANPVLAQVKHCLFVLFVMFFFSFLHF